MPRHGACRAPTDLTSDRRRHYGICMNTAPLPPVPGGLTPPAPRPALDLFGHVPAEPAPPAAGLFADIVFDRPLDHAYTYAVPEPLRDAVAVGKRVLAPFGRGDKPTAGYCVGLRTDAPPRAVKAISRVLDDEVLLTDHLLRLTRWMAD